MKLLRPGRDVIPAHSIIDRQIRPDAPTVLGKDAAVCRALIKCRRGLLRIKIGKASRKSAKPLPVDCVPLPKNENVPLATRSGFCFTLYLMYSTPAFSVCLRFALDTVSLASNVLLICATKNGSVPVVNELKYSVSTPA